MPSNGLENSARPKPALLASGFRSPVDSTGVPTPDLRGVEGSLANVPACTERSECALRGVEGSLANASAASRSQRRRPFCVAETAAKDLQNPPFLIATREHSPEESTRCKIRVTSLPNRHKIHFVPWEPNLRLATRIVVRYYPVPRLEGT